jgi:Ca-activated chloride channel family protein
MASGLRAGLDEVLKSFDQRGINRVVLVGDGVPNNSGPMHALAAEAASRGISITTLGLGPDYNETLMGAMAQTSGGRFHYVERSEQVADYFQSEVLRLQAVYARNAVVELVPGPGVQIEAVVGMPMSSTGTGAQVTLGDLSRDDKRDLIVKLTVPASRDGAPVELIDAVITFDDAVSGNGRVERRVFLGARSTSESNEIETGRNLEIEDAAAGAQAAAATLKAIETARNGDNARALEVLDQAAAAADQQAAVSSNTALKEKANAMRALKSALPSPSPAEAPAPPLARRPISRAAASKPQAAEAVRRAHDEAMQSF